MKDLVNSKHIFIPTWVELMVYTAASFLFVVYAQFENILAALTGEASSEELRQQLSEAFERLFDGFLKTLESNHLTGSIVVALLWAAIGVVSYVIAMRVQRVVIEAEEDLVMETQYVHPKSYNHFIFWLSFLARILFRVSILILIGVYVIFTAQVLLPLWLERIEAWLMSPGEIVLLGNAFLGFVGIVLTIHIFIVLFRLVFLRDRVFKSGKA